MDQTFQNMFSREAEQIHCGDYYFSIPDIPGFDNAYTLEQEAISKGLDPEKVLKKRKDRDERMFLQSYNRRSLDCGYDEKTDWGFQRFLQGEGADKRITDIFREIAAKGIPFMDLGSYHMGMAPYILHLNPDTPCLITNREKFYISVLRSCIQENPGKQNINLAFFDGINIPLKRQSLDVVTGVVPLSGASQNRIIDGRVLPASSAEPA